MGNKHHGCMGGVRLTFEICFEEIHGWGDLFFFLGGEEIRLVDNQP
jgi:hypothetical protein